MLLIRVDFMPAGNKINFSLKKQLSAHFLKPGRKTIKAVRAGLRKPKAKRMPPSNEQTANLMAIKIALDTFGIKDHKTRTRIKKKLTDYFARVKPIYDNEKISLENLRELNEQGNRARREIREILGIQKDNAQDTNRVRILLALVETKRLRTKAKLDKK